MQPTNWLVDIPTDLHEKVRARIVKYSRPDSSGCILWTGSRTRDGYGAVALWAGKSGRAHRVAWILDNGPIPDGSLVIDHLCRTRACVNTGHLELVTVRENTIRGDLTRVKGRGTRPGRPRTPPRAACVNGHPWDENGAERVTKEGWRQIYCRTCTRESMARSRAKKATLPEG